MDSSEVVGTMALAASFFVALFFTIDYINPEKLNPVAVRSYVIPHGGLLREQGYAVSDDDGDE